jgi:hypothetical protein
MPSHTAGRHPFRESVELSWYILRNWFKPGRKKMVPYSIQWLMRFKPAPADAAGPAQTTEDQGADRSTFAT